MRCNNFIGSLNDFYASSEACGKDFALVVSGQGMDREVSEDTRCGQH